MNEFMLGVYWDNRRRTLRDYADDTRGFIGVLKEWHPAFESLEWVGDRPNSAIKVAPDLSNLDDLIFQHAAKKDDVYSAPNPDGSPSWESTCDDGFGMWYNNGRAASAGGITFSIYDGGNGPIPNGIAISFPDPSDSRFPYQEFFQHKFLLDGLKKLVQYWQPQTGRVTSIEFARALSPEGPSRVGWITYVADERAAALRIDRSIGNFSTEELATGGVLFSLDQKLISPDNLEQLRTAKHLQRRLVAEKILTT